jgi:predicted glycosyltransferase
VQTGAAHISAEEVMQAGHRILYTTNEVLGLGHVRIALRITVGMQAELSDAAAVLLVTSSTAAHAFPLPNGLEVMRIPAVVRADTMTSYRSGRLPLPFAEVSELRAGIIQAAARAYRPDLFLVDHRPAGVAGELLPTLRQLKRRGETALVLMLRDIIDDPAIMRARWGMDGAFDALGYYDEIWIYGCQHLYDPIREYRWPDEVARKVRFCGYLGIEQPTQTRDAVRRSFGLGDERFIVVTIGNGMVGHLILETYLLALAHLPDEIDVFTLMLGGPGLPADQQLLIRRESEAIRSRNARRRIEFRDFLPDLLDCMAAADLVISQAGYNTLTEILTLGKRAIVVPYRERHEEQSIRAALVEKRGLARVIDPCRLTPEQLATTILAALAEEPPTPQQLLGAGFDFNGVQRVSGHIKRLLERKPAG